MDFLTGMGRKLARRSLRLAAFAGVALAVFVSQAPAASASGACAHSLYGAIPANGEGSATLTFPSTSSVVGYGYNEDGIAWPIYSFAGFFSPNTEIVAAAETTGYQQVGGWYFITYTC